MNLLSRKPDQTNLYCWFYQKGYQDTIKYDSGVLEVLQWLVAHQLFFPVRTVRHPHTTRYAMVNPTASKTRSRLSVRSAKTNLKRSCTPSCAIAADINNPK